MGASSILITSAPQKPRGCLGLLSYSHAFINGAIGVATTAGIQLVQLLAGTIVVEQVFGLPGLGQLLLAGVLQRDLPLVQSVIVLVAVAVLLTNLIMDFVLLALDPRVRFE